MNLISVSFALFFLGSLILYYLVPRNIRWVVLLIASVLFFLFSGSAYLILFLVFSIVSVYLSSRFVENKDAPHRQAVFVLTIVSNVALLFVLKYVNGLWVSMNVFTSLFGLSLPALNFQPLAPMGMSFYTLALIGYLADVYWDVYPAQKNPLKIALFASYFPSISSGPILRYHESAPMLFQGHSLSYENITYGMQRMLWGLFKKMVIAERMSAIAAPVFADLVAYSGAFVWLGLFAAVIQIYADFSGNMDFIIGVSQCFGVMLPENFRQPFFSLTIQEFWQRWHITLGTWLKDYVTYPLLRSKAWSKLGRFFKKKLGKQASRQIPLLLAMLVLWLVNGLWHSPYPKYMATVLWFWFSVTMGQLLEPVGKKLVGKLKINTDCFSWRLFQRIRTLCIYSVGALFFGAPNLRHALKMIRSALKPSKIFDLFSGETFLSDTVLSLCGGKLDVHILVFSVVLLFAVESYQNREGAVRKWLSNQNLVFRWIILFGLIFAVLLLGIYGPGYNAAEFIYAGF